MTFKLLVVDDEAIMRKGIANFIDWDSLDCQVAGTAGNGIEAIEFIKARPVDIVITDIKMPVADGLAVAKYIHENKPEIRVILLTGYADFEYAKTAIKYNVSAFILKPTNKKELIEAIQDAQKQIATSKKQSSSAKEELAFLKDQLLLEMTGSAWLPSFQERLSSLEICLEHYYVAAFQMDPLENDIAFLKGIIIDGKKDAYCYRYNNLVIAVYFLDGCYESAPDTVLENCRDITVIARTLDSRKVSVGISRYHNGASDFSFAVSEAIHALTLNFYYEKNIALFSDAPEDADYDLTAENSLDLFHFENHLHNWLFEDANGVLHKMFNKLKAGFVNSADAKNLCAQVYYICCRVLIKRENASPPGEFLSRISEAADIFSLENTVYELMAYTKEHFAGSAAAQNKLFEHAVRFIHGHLSEPLSLEIIAEHLHISASHLSRTFKKVCGESLTEYINHVRIEKAKEYLLRQDILAYEAADLVGYHDATYFSSIFKKYTGVSPTEYRQGVLKQNIEL